MTAAREPSKGCPPPRHVAYPPPRHTQPRSSTREGLLEIFKGADNIAYRSFLPVDVWRYDARDNVSSDRAQGQLRASSA